MKRSLFALLSVTLIAVASCAPPTKPSTKVVKPVRSNDTPVMQSENPISSRGVIAPGTPAIKVALLVPLSGDSLAVGNAMMDAANMALYDSYLSVPSEQIRSQIILLPKDTGSTAADAPRVARQALEQGATFVIGPLFSQSVLQVQPITQAAGVPMLTFSNTKEIAKPDTFIFGFLPEQQVQRVADYAFLHNLRRVALLAPNDAYGQKIQESLTNIYGKKGGAVTPIELYAPSPANIDAAVARLASYNDANQDQAFQAIFVADGGMQMKNIISSIKKTNIDLSKIKLLGTGLWDDPEMSKMPEMHGAWFSSSPPDISRAFEHRFKVIYGYKPIRLASLAYDAVSWITQLTMNNPNAIIDMQALTSPEGYLSPTNGLVRLNKDGTNDRKLAIMEVTPSGFRVIEPAPKTFDPPGIELE
ncbi:MAG: penicillin-binding protein activator [Alphaproteobacteria bacterium]